MTYVKNEGDAERVAFLRSLMILDTGPDINLDRIVKLCSLIFDMPISDISLVDDERQWFKSVKGLEGRQTHRKDSICSETIKSDDLFEVTNLSEHPEFRDNPFVARENGLRYYMGAPISIEGFRIGALCVLDTKPRTAMSQEQRTILKDLADVVAREIHVQHLLRQTIPLLVNAAISTSVATGSGTVVSEGTGTTTSTGVGTTTTTGTGTTVTTGTGTTTSTGAGTTTTTGTGTTTTTGTGTTIRSGSGSTTSQTEGLEVTTTSDISSDEDALKKSVKKV